MEEFEGFNGALGGMMAWATLVSVVYMAVPILIIWMIVRYFKNRTDRRAQIVQAIVEKNPDAGNVEEMLKLIAPKQKSLKEKLLAKLLWGSVFAVLGICFLGYALCLDFKGGMETRMLSSTYFTGICLLGIGIVFFLSYFISKKMLAKEIEAEEKKLLDEANL